MTAHVNSDAKCIIAVKMPGLRLEKGSFRHVIRFTAPKKAGAGPATVLVSCGREVSRAEFKIVNGSAGSGRGRARGHKPAPIPMPSPAPAPTAAPSPAPAPPPSPAPAPTLTGPQLPANPWAVTSEPVMDSPNQITMGGQYCGAGEIAIGAPTVTAPTGSYVYTRDAVYTKLEGQPGDLYLAGYGDGFYQGAANGPVSSWQDLSTGGIVSQGALDAWNVDSGYDAAIVQWVWDNGTWYESNDTECAF